MWAPGAYKSAGRVTLPAPNIGIEKYFFEVADTILSHIRSSRNTAILPQRVGPIADVLYSAAGNSADEQYYKRGIIAYSFEAGAQRIAGQPDDGRDHAHRGRLPAAASPGRAPTAARARTCGTVAAPNALLVNEGHDSTMEFAEGNFGEIQAALEYHNDVTAPVTAIEYSAAQTGGDPINFKFNWLGESVGHLLHDRRLDAGDGRRLRGCPTGATKCYNGQGPRRPGEVLTLSTPGAYTSSGSPRTSRATARPSRRSGCWSRPMTPTAASAAPSRRRWRCRSARRRRSAPFTPGVAEGLHGGDDGERDLDGG